MLKIKKVLSLGFLITAIIPSATLFTSCSDTANNGEIFNVDIPQETKTYYGEKITNKLNDDPVSMNRKTMLITAGALVNDKSFNQETWGALQVFKEQAKITDKETITYRETTENSKLSPMYDQALSGGYKTWILTGFQHIDNFGSWLKQSDNQAKFIASEAVIVGVDWDGTGFVPKGQFFGLGFESQEASWVVGHAASEYLSASNKPPHLSSFGGGVFEGVTDFNNGFLQGMLDWNIANQLKKVKFYSGNAQASTIDLNTGFDPSAAGTIDKVVNVIGTSKESAQIILPVAGGLIGVAIDDIKNKKSSQMVIGVDTNQSLAFPQEKNMFFSSIEKKVAMAIYKTVVMLSGIPLDFVSETGITDVGFQKDFVEKQKSKFIAYGFDKGFVGYSSSTLAGEEANKANLSLKNAYDIFMKKKPKFQSMINPNNNQKLLDKIIEAINS